MFNLGDKINFHIVIYRDNVPMYLNIPSEIDLKFNIPDDVKYLEVKETITDKGIISLSTIKRIYIGKCLNMTMKELLDYGVEKNKIIDVASNYNNLTNRILVEETEDKIIIKEFLNEELVFSSSKEAEQYIRKLSVAVSSFKQKEEAVKKLLKSE